MGVHGCAPRPSSAECAGVEVTAAQEATTDARVNRAAFVAMRRRCRNNLGAFGVETWLLADVGRQRQGGAAISVAWRLRGRSRWYETVGVLDGMQGRCGDW